MDYSWQGLFVRSLLDIPKQLDGQMLIGVGCGFTLSWNDMMNSAIVSIKSCQYLEKEIKKKKK